MMAVVIILGKCTVKKINFAPWGIQTDQHIATSSVGRCLTNLLHPLVEPKCFNVFGDSINSRWKIEQKITKCERTGFEKGYQLRYMLLIIFGVQDNCWKYFTVFMPLMSVAVVIQKYTII